MTIPSAFMDEISQYVKVDRETLRTQGIVSLLKDKKHAVLLERLQILARHGVTSREALERAIQEGEVREHPTWEDVIVDGKASRRFPSMCIMAPKRPARRATSVTTPWRRWKSF